MARELKAHRLRREIDALRAELARHQSFCKHEKKTKKHGSSTGGHDPMDDAYWTDFDCPTCLKKWTEEGSL